MHLHICIQISESLCRWTSCLSLGSPIYFSECNRLYAYDECREYDALVRLRPEGNPFDAVETARAVRP